MNKYINIPIIRKGPNVKRCFLKCIDISRNFPMIIIFILICLERFSLGLETAASLTTISYLFQCLQNSLHFIQQVSISGTVYEWRYTALIALLVGIFKKKTINMYSLSDHDVLSNLISYYLNSG